MASAARPDTRSVDSLGLPTAGPLGAVRSCRAGGLGRLGRWTAAASVALGLAFAPSAARAGDPVRDFVMSCSYGVLAGTLVGAAALAFTDKPGDSLNMVARGASIGLYAGILLGLYVTSGGDAPEDDPALLQGAELRLPRLAKPERVAFAPPRATIAPIFGARGIEGGELLVSVFSF